MTLRQFLREYRAVGRGGRRAFLTADGVIRLTGPDDVVSDCPLTAVARTRGLAVFPDKWAGAAERLGLSHRDGLHLIAAADVARPVRRHTRHLRNALLLAVRPSGYLSPPEHNIAL